LITSSFRHIKGIGGLRERQLWQLGINHWNSFPVEGEVLSAKLDARLRQGCAESARALAAGDLDYFARALPVTEHWRLLPHVIDSAAFVDIEVGDSEHDLAVIGVMDGAGIRSLIQGSEFPSRATHWSALVTFNGLAFDLPILQRAFPEWRPPLIHIDLRFAYARLREPGSLKKLEERLGLYRPPHLSKLTGADAIELWRLQKAGDPIALRRLVEYNLYDTFHLRPLAEIAYNRLIKRCGMPAKEMRVTERGALLYDVSRAVELAVS
jgi:uncharacterized protein YprB with RNaseH-like and TPR domain